MRGVFPVVNKPIGFIDLKAQQEKIARHLRARIENVLAHGKNIMGPEVKELEDRLQAAGIPTAIYYPLPLHLQGAFKHLGYQPGDFPFSEKASQRIFSLPMHPYLQAAQQDEIMKAIGASG